MTKYLMIGGAAIGAGALIGVTGGLAAPLIAAGLAPMMGTVGLGGAMGFIGSTAGIATLATGLGAYGASRSAVRMSRRVSDVKFFAYFNLDLTQVDIDGIIARKEQLLEEQRYQEEQQRLQKEQDDIKASEGMGVEGGQS